MKRFLAVISALALIFSFFLSGCSGSTADRENELKDSLQPVYEELGSNFSGDKGDYSLVSEFLKSWAQKNELKVTKTDSHYTVLTNPATSGQKKADTLTLQCTVDTDDLKRSMETLAIGMTALLGTEEHGRIDLIVTESSSGRFTGANAVSAEYLKTDNFINLSYSEDLALYTSGPELMTSTMTADIQKTSPHYSKAFTITMSMPDHKDAFDLDNNYPNPVNTIGNLLATQKSSGKLFQIASFNCDVTDGYLPKSATAVVVIDENNIDSFTKRFEKSYKSMQNKFDKLEDSFVYTMTETTMPSQVMSNQSSDNMISLMYTLKTGVYLQDENSGEIISASDITSISTSGNRFKAVVSARSLDKDTLKEMSGVFRTTSGLCDINYKDDGENNTWSSDSSLGSFFRKSLSLDDSSPKTVLNRTECEIFALKAKDLNMISYNCNLSSTGKAALLNILHYEEELAPAK